MSVLYITGGQQRRFTQTDEWRQYGRAMIARVDTDTGQSTVCAEYLSTAEVCADDNPSITFKCGAVQDDLLYVCTSTEVLIYALPGFKQVGYVSLPCFNDLHHVRPTPRGTLIVANTGLDMVVEVSRDGELIRTRHVLGHDPWALFSPQVDYRKVATTKPHKAHPNHVFDLDGSDWVTRFNQCDAVCLDTGDRIPIDIQRPHDGTPRDGKVYFTTVDGHVVVVNQQTRGTDAIVDLNPDRARSVLGWCRGLALVGRDLGWLGFSRIRHTKFAENVSWIRNGFKQRRQPTHIALYDLSSGKRLREFDLESLGLHTVFSVMVAPEPQPAA